MAGKALIMWTLLTLYSFCKGQTVLTGPTGKVCPGDPLQYTCERAGVTNSDEPLIIWDFYLNGVRVPSLRINVTVEELNESSSVHHENGRTLMGNFSSPGTVVAVLQVNATSEFNTVACTIVDLSNNITISIRVQCGEQGPPENGMIVAVSGRGEGDNITFQCNSGFTPIGVMSSVCTSNGTWFPDLDTVQCSQVTSTSCPILQTPPNASSNFSSEYSLVGTTVHLQCDPGLFPEVVRMATCLESGDWDSDLSQIMCREKPINCSLPSEPVNGTIMNYPDLTTDEDSKITFHCDPGFMPATLMSATCNNSGLWSTDPALLMCTQMLAGHDVAPVVGGVVGGLIVIMLLVLVVTAVVVILLSRRTKEAKSLVTADIEMTDTLQGEYSKLRHDGPKMNGTQKMSPPPPVGSEEYDRITHNVHLVPTTCDNITINSKEADDGYSKVNNGQDAQRLPGYAQLNNMATVEAVVYADLGVVTKKKPSEAPEVDQHTVTYSTLDMAATSRTKASIMPTPSKGESAEQADKLLNLNQALVQLRSVQSRWKELADALRVPDTYIQQIDDMYDKDHVSSMTEIIDCWMRSCGGRPTWRELADALKSIKEDSLAQQLTSIYDTGRLPVELNMNEVPKELYKYDNAPPPPVPARSPTVTDTDSPGLSRTLPPPSKPPRHDGDQLPPSRPPKPSSESRVSCSTPPS